jgi:hypothetical protein
MNKYFAGLKTVEEIKSLYRRLAMQNHPDRGGDTATMQAINAEYLAALQGCHGQTTTGSDKREHTYYYHEETEKEVMDALDVILRIKMDAEIWLIGRWIWVVGDTRPVKDQLKAAGCRWHGKRSAWYWHNQEYRTTFNRNTDLNGLASMYGCRTFQGRQGDDALVTA